MNTEQQLNISHLKKQEHYLQVINRFALLLLDAETIDDILWTVAKNAIAQLGYVDCVIYMLDEDGETLIQRAAHGAKNPVDLDILNPIKIKIGQGIAGNVALNLKGEIVSDTSNDNRYVFDNNMALSEIAVPIFNNNKLIGVIDSEHPNKNFYPNDDLDILNTIASMAATKIVQARYSQKLKDYQNDLKSLVHHKTLALNNSLNELKIKSQAINDSILYAKRIQNAILPSAPTFKQILPNSFLIYKPKDIVAGDFYFCEQIDDTIIVAVADCTGHGVPGAIVSIVCSNALNRAIRRCGINNAANILNTTRELIISAFEKSGEDIKDGMDITLCIINLTTLSTNFAGANNSLHYYSNNTLTELKADKQPVGKHFNILPFTNHTIKLNKGDALYLFTDGVYDQFGGVSQKKFMYKEIKKLLSNIAHLPIEDQGEIIENNFENWKGNLEQLDDVCFIGLNV